MNASNRFRGKSIPERRLTDLPEDVGNRQFLEGRIPSDDLGNMIENDPIATFIHDSVGNSLEGEPSHLKSGFLTPVRERKYQPKEIKKAPIIKPAVVNSQSFISTLIKE